MAEVLFRNHEMDGMECVTVMKGKFRLLPDISSSYLLGVDTINSIVSASVLAKFSMSL